MDNKGKMMVYAISMVGFLKQYGRDLHQLTTISVLHLWRVQQTNYTAQAFRRAFTAQ